MSSTREIDAFDTIVGVFTSYFTRAMVWIGIVIGGMVMGTLGRWMHAGAIAILQGTPKRFLEDATFQQTFEAFVNLPQIWAQLVIFMLSNPLGPMFIAMVFISTITFIATDLYTEQLFFMHLIISPWASLFMIRDMGDFPLFALPFYFAWSCGWAFLWYKREKDGDERIRREEEYGGSIGYRFSMMALETPRFPEFQFKDPNPVSEKLRLPSTEELRASLNLSEPPPDIDTANLR